MVEAFKSVIASYLKDVLQLLSVGIGNEVTRSRAEECAALWRFAW